MCSIPLHTRGIQKFPDWPPGTGTVNDTALYATMCSCIAILCVSVVSFASITLYVASQRVFIVISLYFLIIVSVRKLLDTPSYTIRLAHFLMHVVFVLRNIPYLRVASPYIRDSFRDSLYNVMSVVGLLQSYAKTCAHACG
jgi:hypothetical protein